MSSSHTQIKTNAMQKFLRTYGGMVPEGEYPSEELIEVFENFDSPESMFAWIAARWRAGGFDKPPKTTTTTRVKKDPNKPKWCNAYMHFTMGQRVAVKVENPTMSSTDVTKELGRRWREMSEEEKTPYQEASDAQNAAYDAAMESYTPPENSDATENPKKGNKKNRAEGEPKKALNAYMHFTIARREHVKSENPDMSNTEITKELGRMWREDLDENAKKPYHTAANEDKQRYAREMQSFRPNQTTPPVQKKASAKNVVPKKEIKRASKKKTNAEAQLEEAYAIFVEVESDAAAQEREDGGEEPFTAGEMEQHLKDIWDELSPEDRLEYLEEHTYE